MKSIEVKSLIPGMILATDIFSASGAFLTSRGTAVSESLINTLRANFIYSVYVEEESIPELETTVDLEHTGTRSKRIKESAEFKEFRKNFEATVDEIEKHLNDIVARNTDTLNTDELIERPLKLLQSNSTISIFDMLHNLRSYDDTTYVHCVNVSLISGIIARWCGLSDAGVQLAILSGVLHDIGKIKIPDEIIKKPGKLTKEEYDIVKNHTIEGYNILKDYKNLDENMKYSALMHHERCDGSGYPLGLRASKINVYAKIVAISDVYDAMTSKRCYRGPICPFTVIDIMINEGLAKYDTLFIMNFLRNMGETYLNNSVRLSNGDTGEIVFVDSSHPSKPIIKKDNGDMLSLMENNIKIEEIL